MQCESLTLRLLQQLPLPPQAMPCCSTVGLVFIAAACMHAGDDAALFVCYKRFNNLFVRVQLILIKQ
jgi:hypothetical protein